MLVVNNKVKSHRICFDFPQQMSFGVTNGEKSILPPETQFHVKKYLENHNPVVIDVKFIIEGVEIVTQSIDREKLPSNKNSLE